MKLEAQNHEKDERTERTYVRLQQAAFRICQLESLVSGLNGGGNAPWKLTFDLSGCVIDNDDDSLHLGLDNLDVILNSFYQIIITR